MGLKKKLGLGVASAALGLSLVGGGTFAYFSDTAEASGSFAAGTLDLSANPTTVIDVDNLKPGDTMLRSFDLVNGGSLDIGAINLDTEYTVSGEGNNNGDDFGDHIRVNFLLNADKLDVPIYSTTLADLQDMSPDVIEGNIFGAWLAERGGNLAAGTSDKLYVQYEFVDNGEDQNHFQGDSLSLKWTFEGEQTAGEAR
ncbi:camelysin. Metallo peptidase. MEROPS family M73 [Halobacillus karajensis]|uniref:Spore coat-associated protein N n=1 Tax=Halobacillus karajensis TaxID=195088 RepID=A0A024P3Y6_9BACI|nr:CalY family protein [Halobacillus karajensis]CDQ19091.1 Spore coat-associated protein N precursor [Halobacillus karajensis]CDQ22835.1 Spore coat-associated protein N precursor [Halobacillus karajensis]CDQ26317.1 Spore coat-associated protein N precursor [Halobacillus karajensis]SEH41716.1 camelysin. Metallo peptidase. MEROPS family M73 [Halobacillus karajensis]